MKHSRLWVLFFVLLGILGACTPQKRLIYFQGSEERLTTPAFEYKLQPKDVLQIQVQTADMAISAAFNATQSSSSQTSMSQGFDGSNLSLSGYIISDSGYIELPVAGRIKVTGLNVSEAEALVASKVRHFVTDAWVSLKLVSFKVTVLGEVSSPGIYRTYDNKLNLTDALGLAGDLSEYGNRQKILIIRQQGQDRKITEVDITRRDVFQSEAFNLLPNDVIYVPSLPAKSWGFSNAITPITLSLSLVSTTILIINFISNSNK